MKDKEGNKITIKEFFERWQKGIENLTPQQKVSNEARATLTMLTGFISGIFILIWNLDIVGFLSYALILIFVGNAWSTGMKYISLRQQLKFFKQLENEVQNGNK